MIKKHKKRKDTEYVIESESMDVGKKMKDLQQKLKICQHEKEEYLVGWQKERAEFINFRKGEEERLNKSEIDSRVKVIKEFLHVLDNLDRAEAGITADLKNNDWAKGVLSIKKQIEGVFQAEGVQEIMENKAFNPQFHEAVEVADGEEGEILKVIQKGYILDGRVLRPARVRVGQKINK
jgi:molecular chaperone GrpE